MSATAILMTFGSMRSWAVCRGHGELLGDTPAYSGRLIERRSLRTAYVTNIVRSQVESGPPCLSPGGPAPMNPAGRHRSTRDRPAKAPLSEDAVVDAALAILQSDGLEAVTMRRVAAALDTGAASLYVYVSGREGLLPGDAGSRHRHDRARSPGPVTLACSAALAASAHAPGTGRSSRNRRDDPGRLRPRPRRSCA